MNDTTSSIYEVRRRAYEAYMRRRSRTDSTLKTYGTYLDLYGAWLGERDPAQLTSLVEIEEWFDEWEAAFRVRWGRPPTANTIRNHQAALSSFYDYLMKREVTASNPLAKLDRTRASNKRGDWLTQEEFNALLDAPVTPQERIIVAVYAWTAARAGEVLNGVTQGDVNLLAETIAIRRSKTVAGERVIPVLPELSAALEDWFTHLRAAGLRDAQLPLLVTRNRTAMHHSYAWRVVKRVAGRAGVRTHEARDSAGENVSSVTLHTLRRTLATHLLNGFNGRPPVRAEVVQALCGHSDVRTTLAYYAEVRQETMAAEVRAAVG